MTSRHHSFDVRCLVAYVRMRDCRKALNDKLRDGEH